MKYANALLAKKYATAFLNLYGDKLSLQDYNTLKKVAAYLKKNHAFFFLLNTPTLTQEKKYEIIKLLVQKLNIAPVFESILKLMLKHQRLHLIPALFHYSALGYEERNKVLPYTIYTSHEATQEELKILEEFFAQQTGFYGIAEHKVDNNLIAGVRLQSATFLWEYSIAQQLRTLRKET